jgi:hypothetical protein
MRINRIVLLAVLLLLTASNVSARSYEVKKEVGGYHVVLKIDKNPPVKGDNNISIEVTDAWGRCACDVDVIVNYSKPAMQWVPPYKAETRLKGKGSRFVGRLSLPMAGSWNIAVKIIKGKQHWTTNFTVDVE